MINELYKLSAAMDEAGIRTQSWHRKYKPIPNIRATAPCVRLVLAEGVITDFSEVSADLGAGLRKYGSNQGSYCILEHRGRDRKQITAEMGNEPEKFLQSEFVRKYWDARVFGNTFLEDGGNKGFIKTGVVQFSMGLSLAPVDILRQTNTNEAGVQEGKNAGMAPLAYRIVEHGVYCMPFFVNPNYAQKSGCTAEDIELLKLLIPHAYELNRSAIRPDVRIRHAWYLEHKSLLGSCPDYQLLEALTPEKLGDRNEPSSSWADYQDKTQLPETLRARMASCVDLINP